MKKLKILFVCHGNICRSPLAECMFRALVGSKGQDKLFEIASAAVSSEEEGNGIYPPAKEILASHGLSCPKHKAHRITEKEWDYYDFIIVMDSKNLHALEDRFGDDEKVFKCLDFTSRVGEDIADPWYTGDFKRTWEDLEEGLAAFYDTLVENGKIPA